MQKRNKKSIAIAIATLCVASQCIEASFIDDSTLKGKLRTVYYDIGKKDKINTGTGKKEDNSYSGAWTGSVMLDAESGYWKDFIGFNASLYGVTKLDMSENNSRSKELLNDDNEGFSKLGQAFVKLRCGDEETNADFRAGRQMIYNALISSSTSRSVPSTWQGYNFNSHIDNVHIGLVYVDQMSLRNEAGFHKLQNFDGKQIDYVTGAQIDTTFNGLELLYRNGYAKDFLKAHNAKIGYTFPLAEDTSLTIDTRYYNTQKDGDLWTGYKNWGGPVAAGKPYKATDAAFDDKAENIGLNTQLVINEWTWVASVSHTKAESKDKLGSYYYDFGKNTHGICDIATSAIGEDFMYDNETAWKAGVIYDFSALGALGLKAGYFFFYGSGMKAKNGSKPSENEHDLIVTYAFPQESLKGLSLKITYGLYDNDNALRDTIGYGKRIDLRSWLDYKFVTF